MSQGDKKHGFSLGHWSDVGIDIAVIYSGACDFTKIKKLQA
jgi:hypothetical protein